MRKNVNIFRFKIQKKLSRSKYLLLMYIFCLNLLFQTNELITRTIEYLCKQLYILHRKPFLLQMFGSVAPILDKDDDESPYGDAFKVKSIQYSEIIYNDFI